nr:glutamate racemase [Nakamurella leprariae]
MIPAGGDRDDSRDDFRDDSQDDLRDDRRSGPIGVFDSGVGGLTVARAIIDQLPAERVRYVGDTANGPYGPLPLDEVRRHALAVADRLVADGVKILVIACNTASAAMLDDARRRYDIPVVEVIHPAARRALAVTRTGRVGVLGTSATVDSGAYPAAFGELVAAGAGPPEVPVDVRPVACPSFVDFVERGITSGRQVVGLAQAYLAPLQHRDVDTVVLGCTHYPMLTGVLQLVMGDQVTLVSSAEETAKDVYRLLTEADLLAPVPPGGVAEDPADDTPRHEFLATGDREPFLRLGRRFLGPEIGPALSVGIGYGLGTTPVRPLPTGPSAR